MTAFSIVSKGNFSQRGGNMKEGHSPDRRPTKKQRQANEDQWLIAGFEMVDWNKWTYTWQGNFPVFEVAPGIITDDTGTHAGMVAKYAPAGKEILFSSGTPAGDIRGRLDDEILAIMRHDADTQPQWLAGEWIPF